MGKIGYHFSSEENRANRLVDLARRAEDSGFTYGFISDHFHPWTGRQGQSPFVWSVLGAIARETKTMTIGTGVTCPTMRIHPVIIAQAAATVASMMPGRFILGVGTGEKLNEHVTGARWPGALERLEMLEEAIGIIRMMWKGGHHNHFGKYFTVQDAQIFTLPEQPPPLMVASAAGGSAKLAGRHGDGLIGTAPLRDVVETFDRNGGRGKPKYAELTVCWARSEVEARKTAHEWWPNAALPGDLNSELPSPYYFEQASKLVDEKSVAEDVVCGPDPKRHIDGIRKYFEAGFDYVMIHQVGEDQEGFMDFYRREILPQFK